MLVASKHTVRCLFAGLSFRIVWRSRRGLVAESNSRVLSGCFPVAMPKTRASLPPRMSLDERRLVRVMHFEKKMQPAEIARSTGRSLSAICRSLAKRSSKAKPVGRARLLGKRDVDRLAACLNKMIKAANGETEITMAMLRAKSKCKAGCRTMARELHKRGIYFRRLRQEPRLTAEDVKERMAFAEKYRSKSKVWWLARLHMVIDLKNFHVYLTGKTRSHAAMREVRGAYRKRGQGLDHGYTTVSKVLRHNTGAKSVMIAAGVGKGKTLLWHAVEAQWSGSAASDLYRGPILKVLKSSYPDKRSYTILEDNDPTGFRSKAGLLAKEDVKISVFRIPRRSPDLNVCDYALWKAVVRKMRSEESTWPKNYKETREEYIARLSKAAKSLSTQFINDSIGDMKRRCQRLFEAKGRLFEEGGRGKK